MFRTGSIFLVLTLLCFSTVALAALNLRPHWVAAPSCVKPNASFLADYDVGLKSKRMRLRTEIIAPGYDREIANRYQAQFKDYEFRERYGLTDIFEQKMNSTRKADFATSILNDIRSYNLKQSRRRAREMAESHPVIQRMKKPMGAVLAVAAFSMGEPVTFKLTDQTEFVARTNVRSQDGQLTWRSPWVNGSFDFKGNVQEPADPYAPVSLDPNKRNERFSFGVSRGFPVLDVNAGLSYGATTSTLTTSFSKSLTPHLSCVIDSAQNLRSLDQNSEKSVRLQYGISF